MAVVQLRKSNTQSVRGAARIAWTAALQTLEGRLLGDHAAAALELGDGAVPLASSSSSLTVLSSHRPVSAGSTHVGSMLRNVSTRPLFTCREGGVHWSSGRSSRTFYADSVPERNGSSGGEAPPEGSSTSGSVALGPLHTPSLSFDDFRSLIVRKKSEVAILEAALDILESVPRDKRFEDLVRKHNIQIESEKSEKSVLGDVVVKPNVELEPTSTVGLVTDSFKSKNDTVVNSSVVLEPAKTFDNQQDRSWNVAKPASQKTDSPTMFGKLSLDDFPAQRDPNLERLQRKRRRLEMLKEHERNSKIESLNFGAAAKSTVGGSNPREESPVDPLRPNASVFQEQPGEKTYKSLADRLYEEQFGHPAPPGLKRSYPKGSFYDRCMKEKERKEREAATSARIASRNGASSPPSRPSESVSPQREEETSDNSVRRNVSSNGVNQEKKPGPWKCPECTFFNLAADKYCYRCQAHLGENGERDSGRRSVAESERA